MITNTSPKFMSPDGGKLIIPVGSGSYDYAYSAVLQADGKILLAGTSSANGAGQGFSVVRLNADGALDTSFGTGGKLILPVGSTRDEVRSVVVQADGQILLAGFSNIDNNYDFSVVRLNPDGTLDSTFGTGGKLILPVGYLNDVALSATLQPDGKILLAGYSISDGSYAFSVVRLNADSTLDTSFGAGGKLILPVGTHSDQAFKVILQADGKILLAGSSSDNANADFSAVRLNTDGTLDTSFGTGGKLIFDLGNAYEVANSATLQADGKILLAGFSYSTGNADFSVVRLNADGTLDISFGTGGKLILPVGNHDDVSSSIVVQADGKILVAGDSNSGSGFDFSVVRLNTDGTLDNTFGTGGKVILPVGNGYDHVSSIILQADGKILLSGSSIADNGTQDFSVVRLNADGTLDTSFGTSSSLGPAASYTEHASAVLLAPAAQVLDADLADQGHYGGASLNLGRSAGASADDLFGASGSLEFTGSDVVWNGTTIGGFTQVAGTLTITFNSAATQAFVNGTLQSLTYQNTSHTPPTSVEVAWTFSDGNDGSQGAGGALSTLGSTTVNITAVNDAPTVANAVPDQSATQGSAFKFQFAGNSFVDVDGDSLTYSASLTSGAALPAWLSFDAATRTFSGTPATGDNGSISIDVTADDGNGGEVTETFSLVITRTVPPVTPTEPTKPTPVPVDGVPVTTTPGDGGTTIITIPVVTSSRPDTPGTPSPLADIPLVKGSDGHAILQVSVPVGVALQAQGLPNPATGAAALAELTLRLERSGGGDAELTHSGQTFLSTLAPSVPLTIQTITATAGTGFKPGVPFVISGSTLSGDGMQAVILDARALPSGSTIQVDNVDFIAVVGNVRLVGGAGQNMASGDGSAQYIVLGADDDVIHGGGGNDTVGSKGGDDKVYGDAGNDIVFGGAGNDQLSGGSGSDRLNGGTGFDVAVQEGKRSDYTVVLDGAGIKLTHIASGVSDWLVDVEQLRFDTGPSLTIAHSAAEEAAAFLFRQWMGRDLTQSEGAVIQTLDGLSAQQVAELFAQVFPQQAGGRTAQQLLEGMAGAGAIRVDAPRETAYVGDAGDNSFSPTPGLAWSIDGGAGIDTIALPATLAQMHVEASDKGYTLQRMTDGAMLELMNVERLTLSDTQLALDLDGHAGQAAKLIGAVAGAAFLDNKPLVGEVIRALDAGVSAQSLAQLGLQLLGAKTPLEVTQLIWINVVGSAATPAQLQPFVDMMAQGVSGSELAVLASNLEVNAVRIDLVGLAATGIEFA